MLGVDGALRTSPRSTDDEIDALSAKGRKASGSVRGIDCELSLDPHYSHIDYGDLLLTDTSMQPAEVLGGAAARPSAGSQRDAIAKTGEGRKAGERGWEGQGSGLTSGVMRARHRAVGPARRQKSNMLVQGSSYLL